MKHLVEVEAATETAGPAYRNVLAKDGHHRASTVLLGHFPVSFCIRFLLVPLLLVNHSTRRRKLPKLTCHCAVGDIVYIEIDGGLMVIRTL
jgi:hypothetical protein